ncbi:MAG: type II toxin-antitoxin system TacA family antitoxin [Betaproteobacteria bacterium]
MASPTTQRDERIDLRLSAELKSLLARAASYSGMSLSSFLVSSASKRARELVAERETLTLSARDWRAFLSGLDKAERRRPKLEAAAKRYLTRRARRGAR